MAHELPPLSYDHNALEPHIDARTMEIHHGKHHNAYVSKLNAALENNADWAAKSIDQLCREVADAPDAIRGALINNGGGHYNHSLFWQIMTPGGAAAPSGPLADAINSELGGLDSFKGTFANAAATRFGSGWAWLGVKSGGELCVCSTPNQNNPVMAGLETCPPESSAPWKGSNSRRCPERRRPSWRWRAWLRPRSRARAPWRERSP